MDWVQFIVSVVIGLVSGLEPVVIWFCCDISPSDLLVSHHIGYTHQFTGNA